jgi:hypothetical protein
MTGFRCDIVILSGFLPHLVMSARSCRNLREQECFYLRLRAETFAYELRREMQVRSEGGPWLPQEWVVALERECQEILDTIRQIEQVQDEESSPPSVHPSAGVLAIPPTTAMADPHTDFTLHNSRNIPPSSQNTSSSDTASRSSFATNDIPSPSQRSEFFHPAFHGIEGALVVKFLLGHV